MLELQAALPIGRNESIVAVGQPDESVIEELKLRSGKVVKDIFDAPNEIWLSPPRTYDMLALWSLDHKRPPLLIAADAQDSDFILVEFNCSFLPAKECEFIRALLRIWLMPDPPAREGDAIAYDMFPGEVRTPTTVKR